MELPSVNAPIFSDKLARACSNYFVALNQLQATVFNCYIRHDYLNKYNDYENQLHHARIKLLNAMHKVRMAAQSHHTDKIHQLENLYEIVFSLNTLKLRISDHTTFEVCEGDLKRISAALAEILRHALSFLQQHDKFHDSKTLPHATLDNIAKLLGNLRNAIENFEALYRSTVQVVSAEPILFLFFIQDMFALRDGLEAFFLGFFHE